MKKVLILVLLVGLVGIYFWQRTSSTTSTTNNNTDTSFTPDASSATFIFDDSTITLSQGMSSDQDQETTLLDKRAYGDINGDGKQDVVVLLAQSGGGSGTFIYVGAYVSSNVSYKGSNTIFLGDRITPQSITINGTSITINFLDRKEDEPFSAEPTVSVSKQFIYKSGEFQEK